MPAGSGAIPTLRWKGDHLLLLDQTVLPAREAYLECRSAEDVAGAIRRLSVRGAPAIGLSAAYGVVLSAAAHSGRAGARSAILADIGRLAETRPTAVNLFHCLDSQREVVETTSSDAELYSALLENADRLFAEDLSASREMGRLGADLLHPDVSLLTHCNAGGLATSGLGTALAVFYEASGRGWLTRAWADETRPLLQGARLTAWELERAGIPTTVIPDSAAASLLRSGEVDAVFVGADRIALNGDVANKIGTYPLSLSAREAEVPFYVVAPLSSFDPSTPDGSGIPIEKRSESEMRTLGDRLLVPGSAGVYNPAFDVTPASLVAAIVCEKGVLWPPFGASMRELTASRS